MYCFSITDWNNVNFIFNEQSAEPGLPNFLQHYFNGLEALPVEPDECDQTAADVFPNPTRDAFQVRLPGSCPQPYQVTIYDAIGRQVMRRQITEAQAEIPVVVAPLAAGIYLVELRFAQGGRVVRKLIKY